MLSKDGENSFKSFGRLQGDVIESVLVFMMERHTKK